MEYDIIGINNNNQCEFVKKINGSSYLYNKDDIIFYLNNPINRKTIYLFYLSKSEGYVGGKTITMQELAQIISEYYSEDTDNYIAELVQEVTDYYDNLTEIQLLSLKNQEDKLNEDNLIVDPIVQKCYINDDSFSYLSHIIGISEEFSLEYLKIGFSTFVIDINQTRIDYAWGHCVLEQ